MRWRNEKQIAGVLEKYFEEKGYAVFREQYVSWRRADLIALRLDEAEVYERIRAGTRIDSVMLFFKALRALEKYGEMSIDELSRRIGYSKAYVRRVLGRARLYVGIERGRVYIRREYRPYASEVVAVEIKLRDWRHGLVQAYDYLYGANKSYLAIPLETYGEMKSYPEVIDWIRWRGIGVLAVYPDGSVEEKITARKQEPTSKRAQLRLLETLWSKILENYVQ